jgi:preprotein translocase subunit SecA
MKNLISKILGDPNQKKIQSTQKVIDGANILADKILKFTDKEIRDRVSEIRREISVKIEKESHKFTDKDSEKKILNDILDKYASEVYALTREASKRTIGLNHYDVQITGGQILHEGNIAEMMTGEGKTLVATLPAVLNALTGKGVHVITVNDYLARRDAGWMGQIYNFLGLTVGVIIHDSALIFDKDYNIDNVLDETTRHLRPVTRKEAYEADITYGTNNEYGFDYLRDNMVQSKEQMVQRPLNYAIVDEVDSILVDEARTPLIISAPAGESTNKYQQIDTLVKQLNADKDYTVDEKQKAVSLTDEGIAHMEKLLGVENIYEEYGIENVHHIEQALKANILFKIDKDYVIRDGEIIIVDEFTGRLMQGRRYSEGLHQAIEAKEGVEVKKESLTLATISFQNYFRLYTKLSGMTGTALTEAEEFAKIYKLDVISIPPNKQNVRKDMADLIYKSEKGKFLAIAEDIKERNKAGQPVLVGTVSIEKNELLSDLLRRSGIKHEVLNAKNHEKEAMIIKKAGEKGAVTVATNMAGRGTDIILGEGVADLGGLHVIGTERHESRRIDNQLRGRAGRQGDPGSTQFFVSLEDDLMRIFGSDRVRLIMDQLGLPEDQAIQNAMITKSLESAQRKVEGHNFDIRKHLVEYDDVMNKQRTYIYNIRRKVLEGENLKDDYLEALTKAANGLVMTTRNVESDEQDFAKLEKELTGIVSNEAAHKIINVKKADIQEIVAKVTEIFTAEYDAKEKRLGTEMMRELERIIYLRTIDMLWIDHIDAIEKLREGIGLRGYGQKDPLIEYKNESYRMFKLLLSAIESELVNLIFRAEISLTNPKEQSTKLTEAAKKVNRDMSGSKAKMKKDGKEVGRNDLCPCGSGKKYKKCHGK